MANSRIEIYGEIGWDVTDHSFSAALDTLLNDAPKEVDIYINSAGGSIFDGLAIFNKLRRASNEGVKINTIIDGVALSMGMIIALAGDTITAYRNATGMIHNGSGMAWGDAQTMRETASLLETFDTGLAESIAERTGKDLQWVKDNWMNYSDNWFTAQEMEDAGLIDNRINRDGTVPSKPKDMQAEEVNNWIAKQKGIYKNKSKNTDTMNLFGKKEVEKEVENTTELAIENAINETVEAKVKEATAELTETLQAIQEELKVLNTKIDADQVPDEEIAEIKAKIEKLEPMVLRAQGKPTKLPHSEEVLSLDKPTDADSKMIEIDNANKRALGIPV